MRRLLAASLLAIPLAARNLSAASAGGTTSVSFLLLEQGARGIGMGGAYTAVADDAAAAYWNPAGLANAAFREVSVSETKFIENTNSQYVSAVVPVSPAIGSFGASFTYFSIPGIDSFDANKNSAGKLTANYYAGALSYARLLAPHLTAGASLKFVGAKLATESGQGVAGDVGLQYRQSGVGLGLSVQNMGSEFMIATAKQPLPLDVRMGISYQPHARIILAFDEEKPRDEPYKLHLGAEWRVNTAFTLRGGFEQIPNAGSSAGYSAGLGYVMALGSSNGWAGEETPWWEKKLEESEKTSRPEGAYLVFFDYAFVSYGDLSDTHRLTVGVKF